MAVARLVAPLVIVLFDALFLRASALAVPPSRAASNIERPPLRRPPPPSVPPSLDRRSALAGLIATAPSLFLLSSSSPASASSLADPPNPRAVTTLILDSSADRAGVELYDVTVGAPPKSYPAVKNVAPDGAAAAGGVERGMILLGNYPKGSKSVAERLKNGPYPFVLQFYDLSVAGAAVEAENDEGGRRAPVGPEESLAYARQASRDASRAAESSSAGRSKAIPGTGLVSKVARKASGPCKMKARRNDAIEIIYEARVESFDGPIYDASDQRGTGKPYRFILGDGEVPKGVEIGLSGMCPGEIRELDIPSSLGYGKDGSLELDVPGDVRLWWRIEMVALNFVREEGNVKSREELCAGGSGQLAACN